MVNNPLMSDESAVLESEPVGEARKTRFTGRRLAGVVASLLPVLTVLGAAHAYVAWRIGLASPAFSWLVWGGMAALILGVWAHFSFSKPVAKVMQNVGFVWLGTFGLLFTLCLIGDGVTLLGAAFSSLSAQWPETRAWSIMTVSAVLLLVGYLVAQNPRVKKVDIVLDALPKSFDGFRVVQLSDIHISSNLGKSFATRLVDIVNSLRADVIAVTGDAVDGSVERLRDEVAPFSAFASRHGLYFVTGNHEYYHGADAWMEEWRRLGHTVLHNQHVTLSRGADVVVLAGVSDVQGAQFGVHHAPSAKGALEGAPIEAVRLLLAHQPRFAAKAAAHRVDLMLSGHTHAGQMFPFMFFVKLQQPVLAGLRRLHGVLTYTSAGTGYWGPPFRIGTRGEVTLITLRAP
jgi:uncharacterized protein